MAKLTIEIEENEFALFDYVTYLDGVMVDEDGGFTAERFALEYAQSNAQRAMWI